ncbi:hypothetical protein N657DRAFT_395435 [Parathielavia appendiculata]|uniref:Uncharacterized protein n=1 Tax=Parathielavia appendiculata TaxID=2587402 RepID=A0AAN6Z542_9PEZI|nr:hypothetical protein N657DRAFT_395435 [Parathielavia appendiculata]
MASPTGPTNPHRNWQRMGDLPLSILFSSFRDLASLHRATTLIQDARLQCSDSGKLKTHIWLRHSPVNINAPVSQSLETKRAGAHFGSGRTPYRSMLFKRQCTSCRLRFLCLRKSTSERCNGPRSILQLAGNDSTSLSRMERKEEKE